MGETIQITDIDPAKFYCVYLDFFSGGPTPPTGCERPYRGTTHGCRRGDGIINFGNFQQCQDFSEMIHVDGTTAQRIVHIRGPYGDDTCDGECV